MQYLQQVGHTACDTRHEQNTALSHLHLVCLTRVCCVPFLSFGLMESHDAHDATCNVPETQLLAVKQAVHVEITTIHDWGCKILTHLKLPMLMET